MRAAASAEVVGEHDIARLEVWAAVRTLPERQRHTVVLRYVGDLTEPEIATVLKVSRGTVASNLADARRSLAAALGQPFGGYGEKGSARDDEERDR